MAIHRTNDQFQRAHWRPLILYPAWAAQLALSISILALFSWRLADTVIQYKQRQDAGRPADLEYAWQSINVAMSLTAALCTIFEVGKYVTESLTPGIMFISHVLKVTCVWSILALDVVAYIQLKSSPYSPIGIGLDSGLTVVTIGMAVYATVAFYRISTYDDLTHPVNTKGYGFSDEDSLYIPKRGSRQDRLSAGSASDIFGSEAGSRNSSYSHTRDTQFDEYRARQISWSSIPDDERHKSPEMQPLQSPPLRTPPRLVPKPDAAPNVTVTTTVDALRRVPTVTSASTMRSTHGLVSVPEEIEDDDDDENSLTEVSLLSAHPDDSMYGLERIAEGDEDGTVLETQRRSLLEIEKRRGSLRSPMRLSKKK